MKARLIACVVLVHWSSTHWAAPARALATESPTDALEPALERDVEVALSGELEVVAALEQRLGALLKAYPVAVRFRASNDFRPRDVFAPSATRAFARIWVDARGESRAVLYLVDDSRERFLVRVVPLDNGYDEVARESIGTIVQSSVEALLAGASVGVERKAAEVQVAELEPEPEEPSPAPAPVQLRPPKPERPVTAQAQRVEPASIALGLAYAVRALNAAPKLLHGPELGLAFGRARRWSPQLRFELGYRAPLEWSEGAVGAEFQGLGARASLGVASELGRDWAVGAWLAAGLDGLKVAPRVTGDDSRAAQGFTVLLPMAGAGVELKRLFARAWALDLRLGLERDLGGNHFDAIRQGERERVLEPWVLWPMASLGFTWRL